MEGFYSIYLSILNGVTLKTSDILHRRTLWLYSAFHIGHFNENDRKTDQDFLSRRFIPNTGLYWKYVKGVPFFNERRTEGVLFLWKCYTKGYGLDFGAFGAKPPSVELCRVIPQPRRGKFRTVRTLVQRSLSCPQNVRFWINLDTSRSDNLGTEDKAVNCSLRQFPLNALHRSWISAHWRSRCQH